jgi:hypothetical protein
MGNHNDVVKDRIREMLRKAGPETLQSRNTIIAVAILYENRRNIAPPEKHMLAEILIEQYKRPGWIPRILSVDLDTPVVARQLVRGQEISEDAGLDTAGYNRLLAEMLADLVDPREVDEASAIGFSGENDALGWVVFAVLAK